MDYKLFGSTWRKEIRRMDKESIIDLLEMQGKANAANDPTKKANWGQNPYGKALVYQEKESAALDDLILEEQKKDRLPIRGIIGCLLIVLIILGIIAAFLLQPYFEMRSFNKFSETKASYWDAVFGSLRIEATNTPKKDNK